MILVRKWYGLRTDYERTIFFDTMSDFNVPGSRPKKHYEISEIDRNDFRALRITNGLPGLAAAPCDAGSACRRAAIWLGG